MADAPRRIWLCADDYGITPGVNRAIRELIGRGRINATSVMMAATHVEAGALAALPGAALGLHVTLTAPFKPLSAGYGGAFLPLTATMRAAMLRRLHPDGLAEEIAAQLQAFIAAFGRPPDFVDGHQHVHLLPQVRDAFLRVVAERAPRAWVRQCGRAPGAKRLADRKGLVLDILSLRLRRKAARRGIATNPAFAGAYEFRAGAGFAALFPRFLDRLPDGGLIMCHPGFVDAELKRLDPLTDLREREFAFFNSDDFPRVLAERGVALAQARAPS